MSKIWEKEYSLHELVEQFTVGDDYILDRHLIGSDCVASLAHAAMLQSIGILTGGELDGLKKELISIIKQSEQGDFEIQVSDEDCHTAIENYLTIKLGETGKKIHTGRSRNDQVIAALRLYARSFLLEFQKTCFQCADTLLDFARRHAGVPMPGRTHMQIAMPSSVGLWASAYAEEILDDLAHISSAYEMNNASPLGSAASYGVPLPLDRVMVAESLAFSRVQNNVLYVNNSRGKVESVILNAVELVMLTLGKMAQDLILFSMPEFGYFTLPDEICPGSSIMPQKKNPDVLELVRAKSATVSALSEQIRSIIRALPSGYNRDFQQTKAPFMTGMHIGISSVMVMDLVMKKLMVNEKNLLKGFIPEIYAADYALKLVAGGIPFRDAYRETAARLDKLKGMDPYEAIKKKTYPGTTGNLGLELSEKKLKQFIGAVKQEEMRVSRKLEELTGFKVTLFK